MTARDLLLARGWREVGPDAWRSSRPEDREEVCEGVALWQCRRDDSADAREHGSVTYRATAEQAQTSPLLTQCAASGMMERDVIEHLWQAHEELRRVVLKRAETLVPPLRVIVPRCERCGHVSIGEPDPHGLDRS